MLQRQRYILIKIVLTLLFVLMAGEASEATGRRTVDAAKKEKKASQKKVNETKRKIKANDAETRRNLSQLNMLRGEISATSQAMSKTQASIDSLDNHIRLAADSMLLLNKRMQDIQARYIRALRSLQGSHMVDNELGFLFSSESFARMFARLRYVREFAEWRKRQTRELNRAVAEVDNQRQVLASLQTRRQASLDSLDGDRRKLKAKQDETDRMVTRLRSDRAQLEKALAAEQKRLKSIDSEISRMISQESRSRAGSSGKSSKKSSSPASGKSGGKSSGGSKAGSQVRNDDPDAELTRRFSQNKGAMPFPATGSYTVVSKYGRVVEPTTGLQTNNTGVEVVLGAGASARCVFDGVVSRIFQTLEGPYAVMVRHGAYITVYYNVESLAVKVNDKVSKGQILGRVAADTHYGNKPMLHFEVRKGSTTYDPMQWVR